MEFGRIPPEQLDSIDLSLPPEPAGNRLILDGEKRASAKIYFGCAKWGRPEWVGKIYPLKTREKDFLQHYVQHYNCIELNATHYKIYGPAGITKWKEKAAGKDFLFCPKMYNGITHSGSLKGKSFVTTEFFRGIEAFGDKLGPMFIQVSDSFSPNRKKELFDFLLTLPAGMQYFMEVRHPGWFAKEKECQDLFEFLLENKIGAVITDTAGRRDCAHMRLTVPKAFIRYVGNSLHPTDYTRCDRWVERMKYWLDNGLEELYFFMHMHDETFSPELTVYLVDKLNAACGLALIKPKFVNEDPAQLKKQKTLFG